MGHFSHCCKLSGLPITGGTPAVLIVMKPVDNLYDNSEERLKKFGSTYMCSNEGTRLKYSPIWFPIKGEYDSYGRLENIIKDDNTAILEKYYDLTIEQIMDIVCSGRKDDGYDDALKVIKKPIERPKDQLEGEKHFDYYQRIMNDPYPLEGCPDVSGNHEGRWMIWRDGKKIKATKEQYDADFKLLHEHFARYQEWSKEHPDLENDRKNVQYQKRYHELLTYSAMWIHGEFYDKLTESSLKDEWNDLDFGRPELLNALGFIEGKQTNAERYNRPFTHGNLTVMSDGNWIEGQIYSIKDFNKLAESKGESIDFSIIEGKDMIEQLYDVVIPTLNFDDEDKIAMELMENNRDEEVVALIKKKRPDITEKELQDYFLKLFRKSLRGFDRQEMELYHYFLNTERYGRERIGSPFTKLYLRAAHEGKLRDNLVRFWRFDNYMFSCGRYYEIVGTSPQDGAHDNVMKVLSIAKEILADEIEEYEE